MTPYDFSDRVHGYRSGVTVEFRCLSIALLRSTSRPIARMVALATVVAVFVAAAIVAGFRSVGATVSIALAPAYHGGVGTPPGTLGCRDCL